VSPAQGSGGRGGGEQRHGAEGLLFLNVTTAQAEWPLSGPRPAAPSADPSLGQVTLNSHDPTSPIHALSKFESYNRWHITTCVVTLVQSGNTSQFNVTFPALDWTSWAISSLQIPNLDTEIKSCNLTYPVPYVPLKWNNGSFGFVGARYMMNSGWCRFIIGEDTIAIPLSGWPHIGRHCPLFLLA
jgi:hypothetical protein